ncbi:MAG: peptide-methionine (S)-S-oxide reductase MsrA [Bdellovibrionota bacterium]|nr:peptide-methionine (S)-S-oxide reductase MsrA [Bdellovibrionota bacterium]
MKQTLYILVISLFTGHYLMGAEKSVILAGGCFWCMEKPFEQINGVKSVTSGFSGGETINPSYKEVSSGSTKHIEVVKIIYDDQKVSFYELLKVFWQQVNPTDSGGQFVDRGHQYTTAIFYNNEMEKKIAEEFKTNLNNLKIYPKTVITPIRGAMPFYSAEEYHQDYYKKNPVRYWYYRNGSGRDKYLKSVWSKENKEKYENAFNKKRTKIANSDTKTK